MAILVLTKRPGRVQRTALNLGEEVLCDADPGTLSARMSVSWRVVLIDDDIAADSMELISIVAHAGQQAILFTAEPTLERVMSALQAGALDVITLPIDAAALRRTLDDAQPITCQWESVVARNSTFEWIGSSPALIEAFRVAARAALSPGNVLVLGESGVGKQLLARIIHDHSVRAAAPFMAVNCAALDETTLAAELFGRAADMPPPQAAVRGLLARAAPGTLFLDEVAHLTPALQSRLSFALKQGSFNAVGSLVSHAVECRVIAAASGDLRDPSGQQFRRIMLSEFATEIVLPPLRHRTEDIPQLACYFLDQVARAHEKNVRGFDAEALDVLTKYDWPGNVRQLRNVVESAVAVVAGQIIHAADLPAEVRGTLQRLEQGDPGSIALDAVERRHIRRVWRMTGGHLGQTAELLGIHRNTLRRKLEEYGISDMDARI